MLMKFSDMNDVNEVHGNYILNIVYIIVLVFQEVFPAEYGPDFDKALQVLVGFFLSRLEQLLPVPNFKQVWWLLLIVLLYQEDLGNFVQFTSYLAFLCLYYICTKRLHWLLQL